jgi:hypothetical protein
MKRGLPQRHRGTEKEKKRTRRNNIFRWGLHGLLDYMDRNRY